MKTQWSPHRRFLFYVDISPHSIPTSPPPTLLPGHSHLSPLSPSSTAAAAAATTSRHPIHRPPPLTRQPLAPDPPLDSSMAVTILVLLSALFFMGFFSIYIRRFAAADDPSYAGMTVHRRPAPSRTPMSGHVSCSSGGKGVDPMIIRSLPSYAYDGSAKYQIDCPVCLSEFGEGEVVKVIPKCDHVFHVQCIDRWLRSHVSCPVCRATRLLEARPCAAGAEGATARLGDSGAETCLGSGEREELRAMMRCNSCSHLGRGEPSGARPGSMHRTSSF